MRGGNKFIANVVEFMGAPRSFCPYVFYFQSRDTKSRTAHPAGFWENLEV